jgi:hypothetical protein
MNENWFGSIQAEFQSNYCVGNFVVGALRFGNVFTMRWQKFITSIWEKNVANKKGVDIFAKNNYKNWYNREKVCEHQIRLYIFTIAF